MRGARARKLDLIKGLQLRLARRVRSRHHPPVSTDAPPPLSYFQLTSFAVRLPPAVAVGAPGKKRRSWNRMAE